MGTDAVAKELVELERQYWQAMQDKDVDAAQRLTADQCIITGAQGVGRVNRQVLAKMLKAAPYSLTSFQLGDGVMVEFVREDVAIVAYKVHEELTVEGQPVALDAADASVWVRRDGRWVCALHTESIAGDPFGRDRQPGR